MKIELNNRIFMLIPMKVLILDPFNLPKKKKGNFTWFNLVLVSVESSPLKDTHVFLG